MTMRQLNAATGISTGRLSMLEREMVQANPAERQRLAAVLGAEGGQLFADVALAKGRAS
jgi:transcriptional regulator with XRE-family HTH domain